MTNFKHNQLDPVKIMIIILIIFLVMALAVAAKLFWDDSIRNPENEPFVVETAFNLGIDPEDVTQKQFNHRYDL